MQEGIKDDVETLGFLEESKYTAHSQDPEDSQFGKPWLILQGLREYSHANDKEIKQVPSILEVQFIVRD